MRRVSEIQEQVPSRGGRYARFGEVRPEGGSPQDPFPLKVKEARVGGQRYIVCLNPQEARKDEQDRQAILEALKEPLQRDPREPSLSTEGTAGI